MFKNIQKYLLINHPLFWNLKIVPVSFLLILTNIIFIIVGYFNGEINFYETETYYSKNNDGIIIFFSVLVSILSLILWLVFYFKNNALKSFYPKNNLSLFKEWLLILLICFFNCTFIISYYYGKDVRYRSYFTEAEAKRRCTILSEASFFINGSYSYNYNEYEETSIAVATDAIDLKKKDYFYYRGKKYLDSSLINKNINSYSFFNFKEDSILKVKVKNWLVDNQKDTIKQLFKDYLSIAKEHHLKYNIDEEKWFSLIYDYPDYINYKDVGGEEFEIAYDYDNSTNRTKIDTSEQYYKKIKETVYLFNRYYVPEKALNNSYEIISSSWTKPDASAEALLLSLFVSIGISLLVFSFRVTSGRNWIIALISLGIINIIFGIISAVISSEYIYLTAICLLFIGLFVYFLVTIKKNKGKGISGIALNTVLWMTPFFAPLLYILCVELFKEYSGYDLILDVGLRDKQFPFFTFLKDNTFLLMWLNIALLVVMMLFYSKKIKQWRGIAES